MNLIENVDPVVMSKFAYVTKRRDSANVPIPLAMYSNLMSIDFVNAQAFKCPDTVVGSMPTQPGLGLAEGMLIARPRRISDERTQWQVVG